MRPASVQSIVDKIDYRYTTDNVTADALQDLFRAAELGGRVGNKILRAFKNSPVVCLAFVGDRLVGAARAITDSEYHAVVYDVAVHPEFQGSGVGKELMQRLLAKISVWRVMLVADREVQGFYRHFSFEPYENVMAVLYPKRLCD